MFGDHLSMGTKFDGDSLSRGINFMGIVCPGGQEVGDRKSGDQMGSGPNASQPYIIPDFSCRKMVTQFLQNFSKGLTYNSSDQYELPEVCNELKTLVCICW